MMGIGLLVFGFIVTAAAFFGFRYLASPVFGLRGIQVSLGRDNRPWVAVSPARKALFLVAGPTGCYLSAVAFFTIGFLVAGRYTVDEESMRVMVSPGGPAADAGFENGDQIVSANNVPIADWPHLKETVAQHPGERVQFVVQRGDRQLVLSPTPSLNGKIGVSVPTEHQKVGVGTAVVEGFTAPLQVWKESFKSFLKIFHGRDEAIPVLGPVEIVKEVDNANTDSSGSALKMIGAILSYYLWIPIIFAFVVFPRRSCMSLLELSAIAK